jgi:uracil-DNA glycosylase
MDLKMTKAKFRGSEYDWPQELFNSTLEQAFANYESCGAKVVYPPRESILRAFSDCSFDDCHTVIVGQDPYHGEGQANGLAFSVSPGVKLPPSLKNIYKELESAGYNVDWNNGDLSFLSRSGFLLLNSSLTVLPGKPMSHAKLGWSQWTDFVIKYISDNKSGVKFLLWGKFAETKKALIDGSRHNVVVTPHPSPLSAYRGFLGSGCFN